MFGLDRSQQDAVGLGFVLERLVPDSPYGIEKKRLIEPFGPGREAELERCLHNVAGAVRVITEDGDLYGEFRRAMMSLKNVRGIVVKCRESYLHEVDLFEVKRFLILLEKLLPVFASMNDKAGFVGISLIAMTDALDILDPDRTRLAPFMVDERRSATLAAIRTEKRDLELRLRELDPEADGPERTAVNDRRSLLVQEEEAEETAVMKMLSGELRMHAAAFFHNMDNIGELDLVMAKAALAIRFGAVRPTVNSGGCVDLREMSNPFVAEALGRRGKAFTKISLRMRPGVTLITGANMGGKSVAMKTAMLNIALCGLGFFVFAAGADLPLFDGLRLISGDLQETAHGLSSFAGEMLAFKHVIRDIRREFLFVVLDEFAKGTNPEEGTRIVGAVASYLSGSSAVCMLSTHYDHDGIAGLPHYRVAGLTETAYALLLERIADTGNGENEARRIELLGEYMDYTLIETDRTEPARDALKICRLIGLDREVLELIGSSSCG
ncbi:MAG: hypothetical protein FWD94_01645 [Treponema sp.]|nr:hypothetical protein [Treponema sp.]